MPNRFTPSSSTNIRPLVVTIRGAQQLSPVVISNALLQLQDGLDLVERRLVSLTQPYTNAINDPTALRIHGSVLQPGTVEAEFSGTINANQIVGLIQASQIFQLNANQIIGQLVAAQIGSVAADAITGSIQAAQIASVTAGQITGSITSGQITSLVVEKLEGVIISSQLAAGIIDSLSKFAPAIRPVPIVANLPGLPDANYPSDSLVVLSTDHKVYRNASGTWVKNTAADDITGQLADAQITGITANKITGLIVAGQIETIAATQITGSIQSSQIAAIAADKIIGTITASQILSLTAGQITGQLGASQIATVNATSITGSILAAQIQSLATTQLTGSITSDQITSLVATKITGSVTSDQIASLVATKITGSITSDQITSLVAGKITGTIVASQIYSVNASAITGSIAAEQIGSVNASAIAGSIVASQIGSVNATVISGYIVAGQITSLTAGQLTGTIVTSQVGDLQITSAKIDSLSADKISTGTLVVGGSGTNATISAKNASDAVIAWIGKSGTDYGIWGQQLRAGGSSFSTAKLIASSTSLSLIDATLFLNLNGITTTIDNSLYGGDYVGLQVARNSDGRKVFINHSFLAFMDESGNYSAAVAHADAGAGGVLRLFNGTGTGGLDIGYGQMVIADGGLGKVQCYYLDLNADVGLNFINHTIYPSTYAEAGYIKIKVNGTVYQLRIFTP